MKFWNKAGNDIYIYGEIANEKYFVSDKTAFEFAQELESCTGDVTLHINSMGGSIFAAVAIGNCIKSSGKKVICRIDGICASAATIISSSCSEVIMANNALMMIHEPFVNLFDLYKAEDLQKIVESLDKIQKSIVTIYAEKTGKSELELINLMKEESWFSAEEAVLNKFADSIDGEITAQYDNAKRVLYVNKLSFDCKNLDMNKISERVHGVDKVEEISNKVADRILAIIEDNMKSGAENIGGSFSHDESSEYANRIAQYANNMR